MYVDKNIMGHIYENGKENLVLRFIQKHFIKINLNTQCCKQNIAIKRTTGCMPGGMRPFLRQHLFLCTVDVVCQSF